MNGCASQLSVRRALGVPSALIMAWVTGHQLRFYNSLGRRLEDFTPSAELVGLYSCGPTVYSFAHLGNMRA